MFFLFSLVVPACTTDVVLVSCERILNFETKDDPENVKLDSPYAVVAPPPLEMSLLSTSHYHLPPFSEPGANLPPTSDLPGEAKAGGRSGD